MGVRIDPNARFDRAKQRAQQEENARQQQVQEAIRRKFASQGMSGAGSEIKTIRQAQDVSGEQLGKRMEGIESLQEQEALQRQQIEDARKFQQEERKAQQAFASRESALARAQQAEQFREQLGLSKEQFEKQFGFQQEQFKTQVEQFNKQFNQQVAQFDWQKGFSEEQQKMAREAANLAMEQWDFQKRTEAFNAMQSIANQTGVKLDRPQIEAMIGILGPEIMGIFGDDIASLLVKTPTPTVTPSAGGGGAPGQAGAGGGGNAPPPPQQQLADGWVWQYSQQRGWQPVRIG